MKANEVGSFLDTLELGVAEQHRCIEQTWFAPRHDDEAEAEPRAESSQSQTQTQSQNQQDIVGLLIKGTLLKLERLSEHLYK